MTALTQTLNGALGASRRFLWLHRQGRVRLGDYALMRAACHDVAYGVPVKPVGSGNFLGGVTDLELFPNGQHCFSRELFHTEQHTLDGGLLHTALPCLPSRCFLIALSLLGSPHSSCTSSSLKRCIEMRQFVLPPPTYMYIKRTGNNNFHPSSSGRRRLA